MIKNNRFGIASSELLIRYHVIVFLLPCVRLKVMSMNDLAKEVLNIIRTAGGKGLLIEEIASELGIDSQVIKPIIEQMMSEGLIKMQKQDQEDSRYFMKDTTDAESARSSLSDLNGCPCFHCLKISKCGIRQPDSPVACKEMEIWLVSSEDL
ncbi:MAG: hypothetical protein GF411_04765 [Candidatus Lokiarchaeota archaeon]|nr:hypothetical protein [Candidatus Lokiarchaeota archaeon]